VFFLGFVCDGWLEKKSKKEREVLFSGCPIGTGVARGKGAGGQAGKKAEGGWDAARKKGEK